MVTGDLQVTTPTSLTNTGCGALSQRWGSRGVRHPFSITPWHPEAMSDLGRKPAERIVGMRSGRLAGKTIVLAVTGSISAVRAVELARELIRHGARVVPVMSKDAQKILHPYALEFACGMKPITEITGGVEHVALLGRHDAKADLFLVAPCTGNTLAKMALGIDDSPVTTFAATGLTTTPTIVALAMHETMYESPMLQQHVETLRAMGVTFVEPRMEEGKAKLAEPLDIVERVLRALGPRTLAGRKVLVVNGATQEPIDAMRVLSNRSTGRTGVALAREAWRLGAEVEHWFAHGEADLPDVPTRRFSTLDDLLAMLPDARGFDAVLVPAALSDFTAQPAKGKIPSDAPPTLRLARAPKALPALRKAFEGALVSFKAEAGVAEAELVERARASGKANGCAFVVANLLEDVRAGRTRSLIVDAQRAAPVEGDADALAAAVLSRLAEELARGR
jgi:phosphopantothenoylcysteine decarboxylase/phosphopantothenate--cysteine ligase